MQTRFNQRKAAHAASVFLRLRGNKMSYLKLIKLLYLLDRTALERWERPVTGDRYVSMKLGPVLSNVRDLIIWEQRSHPDMATNVLQRIVAGALSSPAFPSGLRKYL